MLSHEKTSILHHFARNLWYKNFNYYKTIFKQAHQLTLCLHTRVYQQNYFKLKQIFTKSSH